MVSARGARSVLAVALSAALATSAAACAALPGERPPLEIANGTTLDVTVLVNGMAVATFGPGEGTREGGIATPLPPLP